MSRTDGGWRIGDEVRSLVTFNELNLIGQWPMRGRFDVIFCRNVVIYFEDDTQSRVWTRLGQMLRPGGYLYIGHSERVIGPSAGQLALQGTTTYRLTGEIK
jgi:chemotaxis protein methyltransferase CheR